MSDGSLPPGGHTRRGFLKLGAATAAGVLVAAGAHAADNVPVDVAPDVVPEDLRAFTLGVAAGDTSSSTAMLWTRYDGKRALRLVVWGQQGTDWHQVVHHDLAPGMEGALEVPVDQLHASTEYRYTFYALEASPGGEAKPFSRSRVGRFKTAPGDNDLVPVTLGATCCTMNGMDQRVLAAAGERRDLDALVQMGDAVYADGSTTVADYRKRWWDNLSRPGYQALRASTSMLATWDDHEVDNDWDPEKIHPDKLAAAKGCFFEHMPMCRDDKCTDRIWRSQRFGRTVEVFILDSRGERRRSTAPRQYLGREQMDWLKKGLIDSKAMFKVVVSSVPISRFPQIFASSIQDRWETFPEQRTELLSHIENKKIPGVMFLAGDFHLAMIARASPSGPGSRTMEVLAGPGAQVGHALVPWLFGKQFDWASARNNVTALRFDPRRQRVDIEFQGDKGEVFHRAAYRRKEDGGFEQLEEWLVKAPDYDLIDG